MGCLCGVEKYNNEKRAFLDRCKRTKVHLMTLQNDGVFVMGEFRLSNSGPFT